MGSALNSGTLLGSHRLAPQHRIGNHLLKRPLIWMNIPLPGSIPSSLKALYARLARRSQQILRFPQPRRLLMNFVSCIQVPRMPTERNSTNCAPVSPGAAPDVDPDQVRRALASFAATSGAGPSGLRPSHLQDALRYSSGDLTLRLLAEVTSMILNCELPDDIRPWLCGASLMALRKPNNSLRPVAVGETLRRLCSKVCVDFMGSSVRSILEPVQVGVQTKFGCEAVVHATRQWTHTFRDDPDRVLALVDLSNAFNCVSR